MLPPTRRVLKGLPPVAGHDAAVLILGSFPSRQSLATGQYYANPQNQFWKIMERLFAIEHTLPYHDRVGQLVNRRIALWDVVQSCRRAGSADSRIKDPTYNPVTSLAASCPSLRLIACNGSAAAQHAQKAIRTDAAPVLRLPSTSPAHARLSLDEKTRQWSILLDYV